MSESIDPKLFTTRITWMLCGEHAPDIHIHKAAAEGSTRCLRDAARVTGYFIVISMTLSFGCLHVSSTVGLGSVLFSAVRCSRVPGCQHASHQSFSVSSRALLFLSAPASWAVRCSRIADLVQQEVEPLSPTQSQRNYLRASLTATQACQAMGVPSSACRGKT